MYHIWPANLCWLSVMKNYEFLPYYVICEKNMRFGTVNFIYFLEDSLPKWYFFSHYTTIVQYFSLFSTDHQIIFAFFRLQPCEDILSYTFFLKLTAKLTAIFPVLCFCHQNFQSKTINKTDTILNPIDRQIRLYTLKYKIKYIYMFFF